MAKQLYPVFCSVLSIYAAGCGTDGSAADFVAQGGEEAFIMTALTSRVSKGLDTDYLTVKWNMTQTDAMDDANYLQINFQDGAKESYKDSYPISYKDDGEKREYKAYRWCRSYSENDKTISCQNAQDNGDIGQASLSQWRTSKFKVRIAKQVPPDYNDYLDPLTDDYGFVLVDFVGCYAKALDVVKRGEADYLVRQFNKVYDVNGLEMRDANLAVALVPNLGKDGENYAFGESKDKDGNTIPAPVGIDLRDGCKEDKLKDGTWKRYSDSLK